MYSDWLANGANFEGLSSTEYAEVVQGVLGEPALHLHIKECDGINDNLLVNIVSSCKELETLIVERYLIT